VFGDGSSCGLSAWGVTQRETSQFVQWTQNNCELGKRHSKRGIKMERAGGSTKTKSLSEHV
jgi:hypothetical protein